MSGQCNSALYLMNWVKQLLLLSLIWETHLMVNECNDLDKAAEEINEIIRSVWKQHRDNLARLSKKR